MSDEADIVTLEMPWTRSGMTHLEYALKETEEMFLKGRKADGIIGLAHCLYVQAVEPERLSADEARDWFGRVTRAAGCWDHGA